MYGCDAPTAQPVYSISCACGGADGCPDCEGTGIRDMHRCAYALLGEHPREAVGVRRMFALFSPFHAYGTLPIAGGATEQSASLMRAFHVAAAEIGVIEDDERREMEAKMERERLRASAMNAQRRR